MTRETLENINDVPNSHDQKLVYRPFLGGWVSQESLRRCEPVEEYDNANGDSSRGTFDLGRPSRWT